MKSQVTLLTSLLLDAEEMFGVRLSRERKTVESRFLNEGSGFLEVALPALDDYLLGRLEGSSPNLVGWKMKGGLPLFCYDLWIIALDEEASVPTRGAYIRMMRQIFRSQKKIFEVCSDSLVDSSIERFVEVDSSLSNSADMYHHLGDVCYHTFRSVLHRIKFDELSPKHGPGAVADKSDSVGRYDFPVIPPALADLVGIEKFRCSWFDLLDRPPAVSNLSARLIAVPKTATKPRLISIEPAPNQYFQQSLLSQLTGLMSKYTPWCSYEDQRRNQELARIGSIDRSVATIDLSDASDRISLNLVRAVFRRFPRLLTYLESFRTPTVDLPDGRKITLRKFASMGSALTFPVETIVFATIVSAVLGEQMATSIADGRVAVYGDDIIVPTDYAPTLMRSFADYELKVNSLKSFTHGSFRESCGGDYWSGINVTPVYLRRRISSRHDWKDTVSHHATAWQLFHAGYINAAKFLFGTLPNFVLNSGVPSFDDLSRIPNYLSNPFRIASKRRFNRDLQRHEVSAYVLQFNYRRTRAHDYSYLFKALMDNGRYDQYGVLTVSEDHLANHGRPTSAILKRRWVH